MGSLLLMFLVSCATENSQNMPWQDEIPKTDIKLWECDKYLTPNNKDSVNSARLMQYLQRDSYGDSNTTDCSNSWR